jgi:hypothetical protein
MSKLKILFNYFKSSGLKEEYSDLLKLSQMEGGDKSFDDESSVNSAPEKNEDPFGDLFGKKLDEWMDGISPSLMITTSPDEISSIKDFSGSCTVAHKPRGIWYSEGSNWLDWLSVEMPGWLDDCNYIYSLVPKYSDGLNGSGGVLQLRTEEEIRDFSFRYGKLGPGGVEVAIDWARVAQRFDGIEIIPYQYGLRFDMRMPWYYGWDVGSGCIWHEGGVSQFSLLRKRPGFKE